MDTRKVEQLYWDNVNLTARVSKLEAHVADLERRLDTAFNDLKAAIGETNSAIFEAIDETSGIMRDWRSNR